MATEPLDAALPPATMNPHGPQHSAHVQLIRLDSIHVRGDRLRTRIEIDGLRESIAANGLLQPVVLDDALNLVCGLHRLEACRELGWEEIPAVVHRWSAVEARLAEIDENLCRRELTVLERAEHIALRKRLWGELRTAREEAAAALAPDAGGKKSRKAKKPAGAKAEIEALSVFVDDTARRTGRANAIVREEIRIGEMSEGVRALARETPLYNNRRELLALTRMGEDEQREALEKVRTGEAKSVRRKRAKGEESADGAAAMPQGAPPIGADEVSARLRAIMDADAMVSGTDAGGAHLEDRGGVLVQALDDARVALERALACWPDDDLESEGDEMSAPEVLRQALSAVRRLSTRARRRSG